MSRRSTRRGISLVETLATMAVLVGGVGAVGMTVSGTAKVNRRNLLQSQALVLAERELERITQLGCDGQVELDPCANLKALDGTTPPPVFWSANGKMESVAGDSPGRTRFDLRVDVDPPTGERQVVNVRVTALWAEPGRPQQAMALQTRVAP